MMSALSASYSGEEFPGPFFFRGSAPDPVLGALPPMPLVPFFFSRKKKKVPKKKFAGCMNFAKNSTFFPKMLKLRSSASSNR